MVTLPSVTRILNLNLSLVLLIKFFKKLCQLIVSLDLCTFCALIRQNKNFALLSEI